MIAPITDDPELVEALEEIMAAHFPETEPSTAAHG